MVNKVLRWVLVGLAVVGLSDATLLTKEHYSGLVLPCTVTHGCETVLTSKYAVVFGVPLALLGVIFYLTVLVSALYLLSNPNRRLKQFILLLGTIGFISSLGLIYIQGAVLHAWCQYCLLSALTSTLIFATSLALYVSKDKSKEEAA